MRVWVSSERERADDKNPYSSLDIGANTVRDVKNFICMSLDMHGLCDDDYGMELLVAGRIVSLDLSVGDVYEHPSLMECTGSVR